MFDKILIANRGEIACRVIATCKRLGIATVAVYSDADRDARHVRLADEAVRLGPAAARESYLRADALLDAALRTGAQAIHPGYGFLSENADFAEACAARGIVFIGPPASAIRAMGDKRAAKALMAAAGVPVTPGYHGDDQSAELLRQQADAIGYPVLIKASAGGGGKGMRLVERSEDFAAALASCQREAEASFGDARVLLERYIVRPRHIEIQVFADTHGNTVHLFERDCSVQRRHQKVLEEAPAPGMDPQRREAMAAAAVAAAKAVSYVGAGTIEFIVSQDGEFHFMEMNTRLQVEHPVTELITGTDLVEWQLRVAAGQPLPLAQDQLTIRGHALEARLYAEDASRGFLPSTGELLHFAVPAASKHVRIDTGVEQGDSITPWYDPMIAKLIVWDEDRERALQRMRRLLADVHVVGVTSNVDFLQKLVDHDAFARADLDTGLIERGADTLLAPPVAADAEAQQLAALAFILRRRAAQRGDGSSPWDAHDGWRLRGHASRTLTLACAGEEIPVRIEASGDEFRIARGDETPITVRGRIDGATLQAWFGEHRVTSQAVFDGAHLHLFHRGRHHRFELLDPLRTTATGAAAHGGGLNAPMPGRIVQLLALPDAPVTKGTALLVLEAMKMEHTLLAPSDGVVRQFLVKAGDLVADGAALLDFEQA
ncbi:acetyl/propionyl/methylcrotonyl-CoA carboxylase subunit alpha [Lysobacter tyrosinilyticus]